MKLSHSIHLIAVALMTSAFVAACGDDGSGPPSSATVSGVVTAATDGAAVQGATVRIGNATAATTANGSFQLQNLPIGGATIITTAPGFEERSESVSLTAGANTHDVVLTRQTVTLSGVVRAASGAVIEGATVRIGTVTATTAADGQFELQNLIVGNATVITTAAGFDLKSENVTLVAGANTHDVTLTPTPIASVSGFVTSITGAVVAGAAVSIGAATTTTGADGGFELQNLPVGNVTISTNAAGFAPQSQSITLSEGANTHNVVLVPVGEWGLRAPLLVNNSEFPLAEANGKLYVLGGYPPEMGPNRTSRTVQVYDIATNSWQLGPQLPQPNNHGMAASVNGRVFLIGGQTTDDQQGATAVNTVYELDPAVGVWVEKAPMPTARSGGVAVAHDGKIYVAGGRVPRGNDFAVYDVATDQWEVLPILPSQRNHIAGVAINGRIHIVGGRLGNGLSPLKSDAHEVFDPQTRTWSNAAPMLAGRSGINSVVARGCFHVWGGEAPTGMTPQHEVYDPRTNEWFKLPNMPIPIHGVVGSAFVDDLIWVTGGGTNVGGASGSLFNQVYRPAVSCE